MATSRAEMILPADLLVEIQKYVQGCEIYIPKTNENYARWGERSGIRADLANRNREIIRLYREGLKIDDLMARFHLSYDSIRKIVRTAGKLSVQATN